MGIAAIRGQRGHAHSRHAEAHLVGCGAGGGRVQAGGVGVAGAGHAQAAGGGVHSRYERGLAASVPPREYPCHVVGRGQQQRPQRLALGEHLPGDDGYQRVAVANLRWICGCLRRLDHDARSRSSSRQRMVVQDHVGGHHLGDAGDRHRPGRAWAGHHAEAADVSGRNPSAGRRTERSWPLARCGCPGPRRDRSGGRSRLGAGCHLPGGRCLQLRHGETSQAGECGQQQREDAPATSITGWGWVGPRADRVFIGCIPATVRHGFRRYVRLRSQPCHSGGAEVRRREVRVACDPVVTISGPVHDIGAV